MHNKKPICWSVSLTTKGQQQEGHTERGANS